MCGIVGYTGPREAGPILLEGLKRLEYRGYDSAGIALVDESGDLFVEKKAGKLAVLETALEDRTPHAALGLAHTRWATHGRPTDLNAHPHQDCTGEITVIHNGIIENFQELRDGLVERGHRLVSETDTETVAHLVEEAYHGDLADAVRAALRQLDGAYALVVMHRGEVSRLVGARMNVPLIVGLNGEESFIASDVSAILPHTNRVIFLEDGDVADVRPSGVVITDLDGSTLDRRETLVDWTPEAAEKGGFEHFMLKEIHEQPDALENALRGRLDEDNATAHFGGLNLNSARLRQVDRIIMTACGTSYHAGIVGEYLFEEFARIPVEVEYASEF
ncbi:MAG TPA: glutamine--fructose-6-phosphate transaminase (isomerizing), partial [Candidatus Limnocylindrales bacterium]|nr:glutamine--fructose-6-phosphate transaminase (isomerizing) [Candidatus Limnocylindrales bacterium]